MFDNLEQCPICGENPELSQLQSSLWIVMHEISGDHIVLVTGKTREEAVQKWNSRIESDELPQWAKEAIEKIVMDANKRKPGAANVYPCERYGLVLLGKILPIRRDD